MIVNVTINETLSRTVKYKIETENEDEALEKAMNLAKKDYRNEIIVLNAEDHCMTEIKAATINTERDWEEIN